MLKPLNETWSDLKDNNTQFIKLAKNLEQHKYFEVTLLLYNNGRYSIEPVESESTMIWLALEDGSEYGIYSFSRSHFRGNYNTTFNTFKLQTDFSSTILYGIKFEDSSNNELVIDGGLWFMYDLSKLNKDSKEKFISKSLLDQIFLPDINPI